MKIHGAQRMVLRIEMMARPRLSPVLDERIELGLRLLKRDAGLQSSDDTHLVAVVAGVRWVELQGHPDICRTLRAEGKRYPGGITPMTRRLLPLNTTSRPTSARSPPNARCHSSCDRTATGGAGLVVLRRDHTPIGCGHAERRHQTARHKGRLNSRRGQYRSRFTPRAATRRGDCWQARLALHVRILGFREFEVADAAVRLVANPAEDERQPIRLGVGQRTKQRRSSPR